MAEYILANTNIADNTLQIKFSPERAYSRLRIAATANEEVTITTTGFTPAGPDGTTAPESYTLTADAKGNAYLYGIFAAGGSVEAKTTNVTKEHPFTQKTEDGKSYALDVRPLYVDLGLTSGTLWATRNVGADNPWDYGDYFAWGETSSKTTYTWDTYAWGTDNNLTKYNSTDGKTTLEANDDAATVNMGADWSTPATDDWTELMDNCTWTWTTLNGVNGYTIVGSNGNSIFLPAAGAIANSSKVYANSNGLYWANAIIGLTKTTHAYFLNFESEKGLKVVDNQGNNRCYGMTVRAVKKQ